jgi:hypothetical protein
LFVLFLQESEAFLFCFYRNIASNSAGKRGLVPCTHISKIYDSLGLGLNQKAGVYVVNILEPGQAAAGLSLSPARALSLTRSFAFSLGSFEKWLGMRPVDRLKIYFGSDRGLDSCLSFR